MGKRMLFWAGMAAELSLRPKASLEELSLGRGTASKDLVPVERGRGSSQEGQSGGPILGILPKGGPSI